MALPLFFHDGQLASGAGIQLPEDTARHIVQVLRMQPGEHLQLTNGMGTVADVSITEAGKKKCSVRVEATAFHKLPQPQLHIAIAFTKNTSRNEWLLEKATELGVRTIIPLLATRTGRDKTRHDRWRNILVSALIQSQQHYLPVLAEATPVAEVVKQYRKVEQKLVAHCMPEHPRRAIATALQPHKETLILIGPEGDFTAEEVALCEAHQYTGISMGNTRLRTETAAMAACAYFNLVNHA